jgi:hypothetical protein
MNSYIYMNSYHSKFMQSFLFNIWLDTDAVASKDTQRRLIKDNKIQPRDPNVLDVRRTVSARSPSSDLKCPMQIIIFLGQDDRYHLSTKICLNHRHHPALTADAILCGQNDMEQGNLDLLSLHFLVLMQPVFKFHKLCKA